MGTPFEFGLVANTLKEHRWFFNMQLLTGHGYVPTIMPEASKKIIVLECVTKSGGGKYKGEFSFYERVSNGKRYCNIKCEPVKSRKK